MSEILRYHETSWTPDTRKIEDVCDWSFMAAGENVLIIERTEPDGTFRKKNIRVVEDNDGYVWTVQKTRIKANGAAPGLVEFFKRNCFGDNTLFECDMRKILNYAFFQMRECKA